LAQACSGMPHCKRPTAWPGFVLLQGLLLLDGQIVLGEGTCKALTDIMARLNPGFWAPAFVFRSLYVKPVQLQSPNQTKNTGVVRLPGICTASNFQADLFTWEKPTSDGGDWISTTTSGTATMEVITNAYRCPLTGIAVTTTGWPTLRLQFEECPRKTAVEVPLVNATEPAGGMKLVNWMCKVTSGSRLCQEAAAQVSGTAAVSGDQMYLDLGSMAGALSEGLTRMQVFNDCFENLDWFIAHASLPVDAGEFEMLAAMAKLLAPSRWPSIGHSLTQIPAGIEVEAVCMQDCNGSMPAKCHPAPPPGEESSKSRKESRGVVQSFNVFLARLDEPGVLLWLVYFCAALLFLGSALACCCPHCCVPPQAKHERRIKKVSVVYREVPEETAFFTR